MTILAIIMTTILSWGSLEPSYSAMTEEEFLASIEFSVDDIELMARIVMSEASTEPYECKQAVVQSILNRYYSSDYPSTIADVAKDHFSTSDNGEPTLECYDAVLWGIVHPEIFPEDLYWFRTEHYHTYGNPYTQIEDTYFSSEKNYNIQ